MEPQEQDRDADLAIGSGPVFYGDAVYENRYLQQQVAGPFISKEGIKYSSVYQ